MKRTAHLFCKTLLLASLLPLAGNATASAEMLYHVSQTDVSTQIYGLGYSQGRIYYSEEGTHTLGVLSSLQQPSQQLTTDTTALLQPKGIAIDSTGNLYVADSEHNQIRKVTPDGQITVFAGSGEGGFADGPAASAQFHQPSDLTFGPDGSLYVADTLNHRIRKMDAAGTVTTIAGGGTEKDADGWLIGGYQEGKGGAARFNEPTSIAFDATGKLYVADTGNQRIRQITPDGTVTTLAGSGTEKIEGRYIQGGYQDGKASQAKFNSPLGLTVAKNGTIYVADTWNNSIRAISPQGNVTTIAGSPQNGKVDSWGVEATLDGPTDVIVTEDGSLLVADRWNRAIRQLQPINLPNLTHPSDVRVVIGTKPLLLKTKPSIIEGSTYVPLREIAEALQFQVTYDTATKVITLTKGTYQKTLQPADVKISGNRSIVKLRQLEDLLQMDVSWINRYRLAVLTAKPEPKQQ
ncbi:stalk domain-containing protein [Brevibacillus dissolubilis]|uniref:NHL domain-containing protein n=1 Tax=Brevibacillus dissolubilis TaxID=1844116 RepID=UPI0011160B6E|nr:stalk domain-containing protein [Brevibacillus dissolubilis]